MSKYVKTFNVLKDLQKAGYEVATIGKPDHENNPACTWKDGPYSIWPYQHTFDGYYNGVDDKICRDPSRWPASWGILTKHNISGGTGNGHQHQIPRDILIDGTYKLDDIKALEDHFIELEKNEFLIKIG
jgi:hypothetical protein